MTSILGTLKFIGEVIVDGIVQLFLSVLAGLFEG